MDYTVHGILQARILEWVALSFSRGSSQPRNRTGISCIAGGFFTNWDFRELGRGNCNERLKRWWREVYVQKENTYWWVFLRERRWAKEGKLRNLGHYSLGPHCGLKNTQHTRRWRDGIKEWGLNFTGPHWDGEVAELSVCVIEIF